MSRAPAAVPHSLLGDLQEQRQTEIITSS
jgi:hypothetical protein